MRTVSIPAQVHLGPLGSRRLLVIASDNTLVGQMRRGNEAAFSVAFERHAIGLLGFCRHMVGSPEDAEDAVQHTFLAAFRDLAHSRERKLALKPWLYAIARNRCLSMLRARREQTALDFDPPTEGLTEEVERRAELRQLLRDLRELPEDQRAALLLSEAGDLSHAEVAGVLGCEVAKVKALTFSARTGLIQRREARETACADIREQVANLRGNSLRRSRLRHHLRYCAGCRAYSEQVKRQRRMLAAALPVVLSPGLRSSVRAAAGLGGASSGGGLAAGVGTGLSASVGAGTLAKVAAVGLIVGGAATSGKVLVADAERPVAPKPSTVRVIAGRPIPDNVRKAGATSGSFDTWAQEQGSDSVPPSASRPDGEQGPGQEEEDANAAPSGGDDADPVRSAPGGRGHIVSPSSGMTAYAGPAPGKGGPPSGAPDKGGQPSGTPGKGGPPSGTPGEGGQPSGTPGEGGPPSSTPGEAGPPAGAPGTHAPAEGPPPGQGTPKPKVNAEQPPQATAPDPAPGVAAGPNPPPAPSPPENLGHHGS